jgi:very-short-patch-repair endonuclease
VDQVTGRGGISLREIEEYFGELKELNEKVRDRIMEEMVAVVEECLFIIEKCESPIEELMAIELDAIERRIERQPWCTACVVDPQHEIKIDEKCYRVDFLIATLVDGQGIEVVVECDGHEFHEKTKEQAARDKARDRVLQSRGIYVLRFTGSEIWNDAYRCANEVYKTILNRARAIRGED